MDCGGDIAEMVWTAGDADVVDILPRPYVEVWLAGSLGGGRSVSEPSIDEIDMLLSGRAIEERDGKSRPLE